MRPNPAPVKVRELARKIEASPRIRCVLYPESGGVHKLDVASETMIDDLSVLLTECRVQS
jgi:hypothetical protein